MKFFLAKHPVLSFIAFLLFLGTNTPGWSQLHIRFKNISIDKGLSQSSVFALMQDHQGYLWAGTNDGLNRYDGQAITIYQPVQGDKFSLSGRAIRIIHEDEQQRLWVGGPDGDFNLFDRKHGRFIRYAMPNNLQPVSLAPDGKGGFFLGTMEGILLNFSQSLVRLTNAPSLRAKTRWALP